LLNITIKIILLLILPLTALSFTGDINKDGISVKDYGDCEEYYDLQGYYHKECGKEDIIIYKFAGGINKHDISAKYYSDCEEYYDLQGYYHKECGKEDIIISKEIKKTLKKPEEKPKGN